MKETLRHRIIEMLHGWDHLQLSQFTIDWIQEFEENFTPDCPDNAIAYNLDIIREVLCFGADKDFFEMLHTFARLYVGSNIGLCVKTHSKECQANALRRYNAK